ncbi:hypothetical protein FB45DRAFT_1009431 [Roridomyces roridus]|uniref:F-box domain-containing protein n=1 Tax=Roridomyces roridus TaxID=1738132 RepID=A0AAD7B7K3_9AGAR|nr:hypothetical protein FB45DRAFT_1009431 [Roridomyces roridus]
MVLTRRAHRDRMQITRWLPNEVLIEVIDHAPGIPDLESLSRVSKLFHALTLPVLHRFIVLDTGRLSNDGLKSFCAAMLKHPQRAQATRSMNVTFDNDFSQFPDYDLIFQILKLMKKLEYLCLIDFSQILPTMAAHLGDSLSFPDLRTCRLGLASEDKKNEAPLLRFLVSHPHLTHVRLWVPGFHDAESAQLRTCLPNLRHYQGTAGFLPYVSSNALTKARVAGWGGAFDDERIAESLKVMTADSDGALVLSNDCHFADGDALRDNLTSLSLHIPYVTSLQIRSWTLQFDMEVLENVSGSLESFNRLIYFALNYTNSEARFVGDDDHSRRRQNVALKWAETCPTLKACCIVDVAWRKVDDRWEEYQREDFEIETGFYSFDLI